MKLLKLLLNVSLIFICAIKAASNNDSSAEVYCRIDKESVNLIRYNIDLITYVNEDDYKSTDTYKTFKSYIDEQRAKGNFIFYGQSTMFFQLINGINKICLYIQNLEIDEAATEIIFDGTESTLTYEPRIHKLYNKETQTVVLYIDDYLHNFYTYRLIMKFVGSITNNTGDFVKTPYKNKGEETWVIAAADFRGSGAGQIFPCWNEPDIRTNFTISIKHHRNYTAISNTPIDMESTDDNDMVRTRFKTTDRISPYHVAIVLTQLDHIPEINVRCRPDVKQQIKFAYTIVNNATFYLKRMFNTKLPPKVDHVIIPDFQDQSLESWGLVLYREAAILYDSKLDPFGWKFEVSRTVARKMVHQLFGNLVGLPWSYLWLNEGIASFLAMKIVKQYVHLHIMDLFVVQYQHESFRLNDYYDMPLVSEVITPSDIDSLFSFTYYVKAPVFIRTLIQTVSIHSFEIGLNKYLSTYKLKSMGTLNNTINIFFDVLEKALIPLEEFNFNLTIKLSQWTKQKRYPIVQVTREFSGGKVEIKLSQEYVNENQENLWTHITYSTQSIPSIGMEEWLSPHNPTLHLTDINKNDWIIVNVQQAGYYRVNYDKDNWQRLMKYLNSIEYLNIPVLNRAQIIDDTYYFLLNNKLDFRFFKNLTYYLSNEEMYVAWYPMFKILEEISSFFPFQESTEVKEHFQEILNSVLRQIGYTDMANDDVFTKCLRREATKWACTLKYSEYTTNASLSILCHEEPFRFLPGWRERMYCKGLMSVYYTIKLRNNHLLKLLACTQNHTVILSFMDSSKLGYLRARDRISIFYFIITRHAKNNLVLDHIINNFARVVPSEIKAIVALTSIINHLYFNNQFNKIRDFVQTNFNLEISASIGEKINTRLLEIKRHIDYFKNFLKTKS